jgi:hypothetical protein
MYSITTKENIASCRGIVFESQSNGRGIFLNLCGPFSAGKTYVWMLLDSCENAFQCIATGNSESLNKSANTQ